MLHRCLAYGVLLVCCAGAPDASAQAQPRAVVELFTSQGCSSCPAADRLLAQLAQDASLIAVSVPIDYWDYLGWKDTLADPRHSARQRGYADARGDGQVYTPQAVVSGKVHVLGSDKSAIEHAIGKTRKMGAMALGPVTLVLADGHINVNVPGAVEHREAEVWLCGVSKTATVAIARGENKGRTVTYHNVVRRWLKLGDWTGKAHSWSVPMQALKGDEIDRAAILVQTGTTEEPKMILGATLAAIR
jgi:hypothetical protein